MRALIASTAVILLLAGGFAPTTVSAADGVEFTEWEVPWEGTQPRDPYVDGEGRVWFVGQRGDYLAYLDPSTGEFERYDLEPGYRDGPPPAHTGGFTDDTCHACHFDNDLNDASGSLTLDGVPVSFGSPEPSRLTITLTRPGLAVAGFQLAVRIAEGPGRGRQAGTLRAVDDRVQIVADGDRGVVYAQHTETGAAVRESGTWIVEWSPGSVEAPVVFHVAANAANDDFSEFGDYIYTLESTSDPTQGP